MDSGYFTAFGVLITGLVSALVTLLVARRGKSGKIDTSEAASLWAEGTTMRQELRTEVASLREKLNNAIEAIASLNEQVKKSREETEQAREETRQARLETKKLQQRIEDVHNEVTTSNSQTLGELADNVETRRVLQVPREDRTPAEIEHIASAGERMDPAYLPEIPLEDRRKVSEEEDPDE